MIRSLTAFLVCLVLTAPARAGLKEGVAAFERKDYPAALNELRPLAEQGNAEAQAYVGSAYLNGWGMPANALLGAKLLRLAAERGNPNAENWLGGAYLNGTGVAKDLAEAASWFRKAAEQNVAPAAYSLGLLYLNGTGVVKDAAEAVRWFRRAAVPGNAVAEYELGISYYSGRGVAQDFGEALKWLRRSADDGSANAENLIGTMYSDGMGIAVNLSEAVKWFAKAATRGHAAATYNLANAYYNGKGIAQDYRKAEVLYIESAQQGFAFGQYASGMLYMRGIGVPQDFERSYFWLSLAVSNLPAGPDLTGAIKARDSAAAKLSSVQIARAQQQARDWKPRAASGARQAADAGPQAEPKKIATGSGFVVSRAGYILTNRHVIASCSEIRVKADGGASARAEIAGQDEKNDLALLRANIPVVGVLRFRDGDGMRPGDAVIALGYPLAGMLANEMNVTLGAVSSLAGVGGDNRFLQMSAPIQQGNSGGPLLDRSGNVVGIVTSKLNALALAGRTGDIAQNVNFALKASVIRQFLDANHVAYETAPSEQRLEPADVGELGRRATLSLECWR